MERLFRAMATGAQWTTSVLRRVRARVELAKIYEHRLREPGEALAQAEQAVTLIDEASLHVFFALTRPALEKRISRLRLKVVRSPTRTRAKA